MHILRGMGSKFCVKFQREPLKFHTKFWTHTPQNMYFTVFYFCVWVTISLNCDVISLSETGPWAFRRQLEQKSGQIYCAFWHQRCHYCDVTWMSCPLESLATRLFARHIAQDNNIENIQAGYYKIPSILQVDSTHKSPITPKMLSCFFSHIPRRLYGSFQTQPIFKYHRP